MAKFRIDLPERYAFSTVLPLRITDINYGGHLGNDAVLALAHEARVRFLRSLDASETDVGGPGLIMGNARIVFAAEGHYGMELEIAVAVAELSAAGFDLLYRVTDRADGREIARIATGMVCFDYQRRRPVKLPGDFRARLETAAAV